MLGVWAGHVELKMGRDGGGERRPTTRCVHEAVGRQYNLLGAMDKTNAERARHTTLNKTFDDQPLEQRPQKSLQGLELGAKQWISAAAVRLSLIHI